MIAIDNLTVSFGGWTLFDEISFLVNPKDRIGLVGKNGAGKTTLVSRIAARLGAEDTVTSPTFALVNQYEGRDMRIYHFDFYRINSVAEAFDMGYEEYFYSGDLCLVEWPEKVEQLLPDDTMVVRIEILDPTTRKFIID